MKSLAEICNYWEREEERGMFVFLLLCNRQNTQQGSDHLELHKVWRCPAGSQHDTMQGKVFPHEGVKTPETLTGREGRPQLSLRDVTSRLERRGEEW